MVVTLAALAGAETLVADVLTALAHFVVTAIKYDILKQLAVQTAVIELVAHRRLQAHLVMQLVVIADEPHVIALEGVLEFVTQVAVQRLDILGVKALAVGRVADEGASGWHVLDVVDIAALQLDIFDQTGVLDVGTGNGDGLALDVAAVNLVGKLALGTVIVIHLLKQVGVIVGPLLEGIMVAVHARSDIGSDERSLDEERTRTAHGVNQVGFPVPAAQQDNAGCQYLVDGSIGLCHTPAALEQGVTTAVERQGNLTSGDMDIKTDVGIGKADAGALAVLIVEVVGNGILHTISDKA